MIHALVGLVRLEFLSSWRYWLNFMSGTLWSYLLFVLLFFGVHTFAAPGIALGEATDSLMVGFWVYLLVNISFQSLRYYLSMEAQQGTLEQLYLSPFPFWWLAFGRILGNFLHNLAFGAPFLFLQMLTTGRWLTIDVVSVLPLVVLIMAQAYGIGLVMAGITLIHKRVSVLDQVVTMLFAVLIVAPPELARFLPLNLAWRLLREMMADGIPIWSLPTAELAFVLLQAAVLMGLGWGVYRGCEGIARRQALLGQY